MPAQKLLLGTFNPHKVNEIRQMLGNKVEVITCADVPGLALAPETGYTLADNAQQKALFYAQTTGLPTLADDSGLEVAHLGGAPGVHTAHYAGHLPTAEAQHAANNALLLTTLAGVPPEGRGAIFRTVMAYVPTPDAAPLLFEGSLPGHIATEPTGHGGFGYDPLFVPHDPPGNAATLAEMTADEKNACSHRGRALRAFVHFWLLHTPNPPHP